ncbi:MAG: exonuclease domain-containing protein [Armatimonadota bacterium]
MSGISPQATIVALDLETTGLSATRCRIVEFAAVRWQGGQEVGHFQTMVNPGIPIPHNATRIHGITNAMVQDMPSSSDVLPAFLAFCEADLVIAHNAQFDVRFLRAEATRLGIGFFSSPILDTCSLARQRLPGCPNYRLETLKGALGLGYGQAHRALEDARDCLSIYLRCQEQEAPALHLPIRPAEPLADEFIPLRETLERGGTVFIEYVDSRGRATNREVRPLVVSRTAEGLVLEAHCLLRNELRHFMLERIKRIWRTT